MAVVVVAMCSLVAVIAVTVAGLPAIVGIRHLTGMVIVAMAMIAVPSAVVVAVVIMAARFMADILSMAVAMIPMVGQYLIGAKPGCQKQAYCE